MPKYKVPVTYTFTGTFSIEADSSEEAQEYAEKHCGMTESRGIHSSLPDETVDWDFPCHPEKTIGDAEKIS